MMDGDPDQEPEKKYIKLRGKNKPFDRYLYDKYDTPARNLMKEKLGDKIKDNPDIYGEDMIIVDDKCKYKYIELQVCAEWIGEKYPHPFPYVFERKGSFSKDTLFIILSRNFIKGLIFDKESLKPEPTRIRKYARSFKYETPWHRVVEFYFDEFNMDMIYFY